MKRIPECVKDCEASLELDQGCLAAMLQRAKCHMENKEWEQAVRIFERMNNRDRHNQQSKKKAGEAALKNNNHDEAYRYAKLGSCFVFYKSIFPEGCLQRLWMWTNTMGSIGIC